MDIANNIICFVTAVKLIIMNVEFCPIFLVNSINNFIFLFVHSEYQDTNKLLQELLYLASLKTLMSWLFNHHSLAPKSMEKSKCLNLNLWKIWQKQCSKDAKVISLKIKSIIKLNKLSNKEFRSFWVIKVKMVLMHFQAQILNLQEIKWTWLINYKKFYPKIS